MADGFMLMYKDPHGLQVVVHSTTEFSTVVELSDIMLHDGLARTATSPIETQACRIWTVTVRGKILPRIVGRSAVQDIHWKLTLDCAGIRLMPQSARTIATLYDMHQALRTLRVVQMQPIVLPTLQAPMPPSSSSASSALVVRPGNNVHEHHTVENASTGDHWFCLCGKKLSRSVWQGSRRFEQQCKTS